MNLQESLNQLGKFGIVNDSDVGNINESKNTDISSYLRVIDKISSGSPLDESISSEDIDIAELKRISIKMEALAASNLGTKSNTFNLLKLANQRIKNLE